MMTHFLPLLLPATLVLLVLASRRFKRAVQPLRLKMAELGETLLADPNVSAAAKDQIRMYLDTAFGARAMLIFGILVMPFAALAVLLRPRLLRDADRELALNNVSLRSDFNEVQSLHMRITLANNTLFSLIFCVELAVLMPLIAIGQMIVGAAPIENGVDALVVVVQNQKKAFHIGHWRAA